MRDRSQGLNLGLEMAKLAAGTGFGLLRSIGYFKFRFFSYGMTSTITQSGLGGCQLFEGSEKASQSSWSGSVAEFIVMSGEPELPDCGGVARGEDGLHDNGGLLVGKNLRVRSANGPFEGKDYIELPFVGDERKRQNGSGYKKGVRLKKKKPSVQPSVPRLIPLSNFSPLPSVVPSTSSPFSISALSSLHPCPSLCTYATKLSGILWRITEGACTEVKKSMRCFGGAIVGVVEWQHREGGGGGGGGKGGDEIVNGRNEKVLARFLHFVRLQGYAAR